MWIAGWPTWHLLMALDKSQHAHILQNHPSSHESFTAVVLLHITATHGSSKQLFTSMATNIPRSFGIFSHNIINFITAITIIINSKTISDLLCSSCALLQIAHLQRVTGNSQDLYIPINSLQTWVIWQTHQRQRGETDLFVKNGRGKKYMKGEMYSV